jgi:hypothetical protein
MTGSKPLIADFVTYRLNWPALLSTEPSPLPASRYVKRFRPPTRAKYGRNHFPISTKSSGNDSRSASGHHPTEVSCWGYQMLTIRVITVALGVDLLLSLFSTFGSEEAFILLAAIFALRRPLVPYTAFQAAPGFCIGGALALNP